MVKELDENDAYDTLVSQLEPLLQAGDAVGCERLILDRLAGMPESPFHIAIGMSFCVGPPIGVAKEFDAFYSRQSKRYPVGALYTEMNAFQTNTRRWYFEKFAYRKYGGRTDDFGWLSRWDGESSAQQLMGMYKLQRVYASKAGKASDQFEAFLVVGLLVQARFWRMLADASLLMKKVNVPLLVSAHDTGLILELHPNAKPGATPGPSD